jgi:hypothetical protein
MQFVLNINVDNAAFGDEETDEQTRVGDIASERAAETARILREVAARIEAGEITTVMRTVRDSNGNDIGRASFKDSVPTGA